MSGLSSSWVDTIGWMLLHSLWQGAAVAMALALVLRLLRGAPAQERYLAACVAMALMIVLPATAFRRSRAIPSVVPAARAMDPQPTTAEGTVATKLDGTLAPRPWQTRIVMIFPAIVGLWMTGAGVLSLRLLGGWVLARRLVRRDTRPVAYPWIDRLKERMGIRYAVAFLESAHVEVPMAIGWLRPAILVPVAALSGLTAPELEAILAHELAHIRRHDYVVNILQCVIEVLMFYHPATWWITRVIRREREHCCDDMAVAASRDRLTYARALAVLEGLRAPAFSLSPAANGGNLLARVRRILKPQEESMKPVRILVGLAVVLAFAPIWLTRADDQPTTADPGTGRPPLNRVESAAGVRAEVKAWKEFLPIAEIDAAPTGRIMIRIGTISEIGFEGNASIPPEKIKPKLLSRVGQPLDLEKVEADCKSLSATKWFSDVRYFYDEMPPGSKKYTLTYRVREMPLLTKVEFKGRKAILLKEIEDTTGLKAGDRANPAQARMAVRQIQRLYSEKGYDLASVTLLEGGNTGDSRVVIEIFEGPKLKIGSISFLGNTFATDATLRTKIGTKMPIPGLLGNDHRDLLDEDRRKLIEYYQKQGFFEVKITPVTRPNNEGKAELTFVISEGTRYQVRNLIIEGNTQIKTEVLREGMELHSGKPFVDSVRNADKNRLLAKYYEIGYIEADVVIEPKFTEQPGVVDLLYHISEGEPYLLGELDCLKDHVLDKINDAEAEKTFQEGMYYKRTGKAASAAFYFAKVLQRWPNSPWAVKAKEQQSKAEPKPADRTKVDFFNFLFGGFY